MRNRIGIAVLALVLLAAPLFAQTTVSSTTLAAAVTSSTDSVLLTSAASVVAGNLLYVDREAMTAVTVNTTTNRVTVIRGAEGTAAAAHANGLTVYYGAPVRFYRNEVSGACTSTNERFLPHIVINSGNVYDCGRAGIWIDMSKLIYVTCRALLVADQIDQTCFTADRPYAVYKITEVHAVAETAGTLTLIPRRQQSTEAPASGDNLLAAAIDMVGAGAVAETVKTPTLSATASVLTLFTGNRLGLDFTDDTAGELAGVVVTFALMPLR